MQPPPGPPLADSVWLQETSLLSACCGQICDSQEHTDTIP